MTISAGKGASVTDQVDLSKAIGVLGYDRGGTGVVTHSAGHILIGNSDGSITSTTLTAGQDVVVTSTSSSVAISVPYAGGQKLLARLTGANMAISTDQAFTFAPGVTKYLVRRVMTTNPSTSMALLGAAGGIYNATGKGGSALVAAGQTYAGLTAASKFTDLTLAALLGTDILTGSSLYLSLTVTSSAPCTADFYIFGDDLS